MAINKAMKAALKVLSYPDPDIKKSYKLIRRFDRIVAKRLKNPNCRIDNLTVEREGYPIPVRVFSPLNNKSKGVILFFHGGGWVNGDIDSYTPTCIDIEEKLCRTVVSVDYRRAPEHKFPTAPEDCYAVTKKLFCGELLPEFLPEDIILMGDSAGGNLAAAVSLMAHDRGDFKPKRQILIYPATYNDHSPSSPFASIRENGTDYMLTSKRIVGYMKLYASKEEDLQNPYLAPLLAKDLHGQPDTLIISAQYCPLRDEGEEYGRRLADAGSNVSVFRMPNAIHGYFSLPIKLKLKKKTYSVIRRFLGDDRAAESQPKSWIKLDNAAKIFPPTTSKRDAKVFRFFCELKETVEPRALQAALDECIKSFPFYRSILKKGIFWYYFESTDIRPLVREEHKEPCSEIFNINRKDLLFEVSYYKKRINLEVYHALSDGGGAAKFFETLISFYLKKLYSKDLANLSVTDYDASGAEKQTDSFYKHYSKRKTVGVITPKRAYHIKGERLYSRPLCITEGEMPVSELLNKAHEYGVTLTAFLLAVFIKSIGDSMPAREKRKNIVIDVPVNLRNYFESKSARNFFGIIDIEYNFKEQPDDLESIIKYVNESMRQNLDKSKIAERMTGLTKMENLLPTRMLPVFVKDPGLKIANHFVEMGVTAAFSNIGKISMPEGTEKYINKFGVLCSTKRIQGCMCSFGGSFVITFTTPFVSSDIQCRFFRILTGLGINVRITSNSGSEKNAIL